ncbi:hypothetical protein ACHRV5_10890 [Flavobacterium sp. FlaQc-52]|uniref:hypothetical protein n=1 Tax=Flavobacterium sp. FlaQc-52 TaxID=3374185 RepID=UPI0037577FEB
MENINITFGCLSDYRFALKVKIFDGTDKEIKDFKAEKEQTILVKPGIYTIRLELNGIIKDHVVRVHKEQRFAFRIPPVGKQWEDAVILSLPMIYSSIPFDDENYDTYKSSHEYYSSSCIAWSQKSTSKKMRGEPVKESSSSIFIFFRFPNHEQFEILKNKWSPAFHKSFQLYDEQYELIESLDKHTSIINKEVGSIAFNLIVQPGTYYIKIAQNGPSQMIPVQVFANWHSQIFMTLGEQPLYGTLRIILSPERKFDSRNVVNKYIDILADKIQNNEVELSTELIQYVANHKTESPMLALLCIYAYMNGESDVNDSVIERMITVLNELILPNNSKSPDIIAIELLAERYLGKNEVNNKELSGVPMLRLGVQAISDAAMQWPLLIGHKGMLDYAIEGLQRSSVFTVFEWDENNVLNFFDNNFEILTDTLTGMVIKAKGFLQKKNITADQILEASAIFLKNIEDNDTLNNSENKLYHKFYSAIKKIISFRRSVQPIKDLPESKPNINLDLNIQKNAENIKNNNQSTTTAMYVADMVIENPDMSIEQISKDLNIPEPTIARVLSKNEINRDATL